MSTHSYPTPDRVFYGKPENRYHQYGQADTIRAIQAIGAAWQKRYPQGPRIGITDISLRGGGDTPNHSGHENGLEVDFRLFRNDGLETGSNIRDSSYSRSLTQELVNTILANGILKVDKILFNDSGVTPVRPSSGHDDHLHVYFLAGTNQPVHNPGSTTITKPITGTLRDKIGLIAKEEYVRWGNGSTKESDPRIQSVLRDYWITGVGSEEGYQQKYYWSAAFISWVIKKQAQEMHFNIQLCMELILRQQKIIDTPIIPIHLKLTERQKSNLV